MENKEIVRNFFRHGYDNHDYCKVRELLFSKYYDHSPAAARCPEDTIQVLKIIENAFQSIHVEVCDLIEEGNLVAGRFVFSGIHVGEYMGIKPTLQQVEWEFLENFRVENGKITESWGYWPDLEIMNKLSGK